jgi:hypothetical protein
MVWRLYCDGHEARGETLDMTDLGTKGVTTVSYTPDQRLHFCPECSDIWFQHAASMRKLAAESLVDFRKRQQALKASLWEMFKDAKPKEAPNTQESAPETGPRWTG